jgi:hypothetical protein
MASFQDQMRLLGSDQPWVVVYYSFCRPYTHTHTHTHTRTHTASPTPSTGGLSRRVGQAQRHKCIKNHWTDGRICLLHSLTTGTHVHTYGVTRSRAEQGCSLSAVHTNATATTTVDVDQVVLACVLGAQEYVINWGVRICYQCSHVATIDGWNPDMPCELPAPQEKKGGHEGCAPRASAGVCRI